VATIATEPALAGSGDSGNSKPGDDVAATASVGARRLG
jgi:hypothetical protein